MTGSRAASTALGEQHARSESGPRGSIQRRSVTPTAPGPARSSATALSTPPLIATATRPRRRRARERRARARSRARRPRASRRRPRPPRAGSGRARSSASPSASASTIRPPVDPQADERPVGPAGRVSDELPHLDGQGTAPGKRTEGARLPPSCSDTAGLPRPCEPGQARWVPCGRRSVVAPGPTRAPCHMVLVLHGCAASRTASGNRTTVPTAQLPRAAYAQWTVCTPRSPSRRASASVRSNCRPPL